MTSWIPHRPNRPVLLLPLVLLAVLLLSGAGCTPPPQDDERAAGAQAEAAAAPPPVAAAPSAGMPPVRDTRPPSRPAPPMSDPLPPVRAPERAAGRPPGTGATPAPVEAPAGAAVRIDTSCTGDADCVVKNVGNCCGYYPACVNVDSPTDPAAVQAQCARTGTMSVCGFPSISACQCVAGKCQGDSAAVAR